MQATGRLFPSPRKGMDGRIKAVDRPGDFLDHCGTPSLFDKCLGNGPLRCFGKGFSKRPGDHAITVQRRFRLIGHYLDLLPVFCSSGCFTCCRPTRRRCFKLGAGGFLGGK
jgi:hypothetical protein